MEITEDGEFIVVRSTDPLDVVLKAAMNAPRPSTLGRMNVRIYAGLPSNAVVDGVKRDFTWCVWSIHQQHPNCEVYMDTIQLKFERLSSNGVNYSLTATDPTGAMYEVFVDMLAAFEPGSMWFISLPYVVLNVEYSGPVRIKYKGQTNQKRSYHVTGVDPTFNWMSILDRYPEARFRVDDYPTFLNHPNVVEQQYGGVRFRDGWVLFLSYRTSIRDIKPHLPGVLKMLQEMHGPKTIHLPNDPEDILGREFWDVVMNLSEATYDGYDIPAYVTGYNKDILLTIATDRRSVYPRYAGISGDCLVPRDGVYDGTLRLTEPYPEFLDAMKRVYPKVCRGVPYTNVMVKLHPGPDARQLNRQIIRENPGYKFWVHKDGRQVTFNSAETALDEYKMVYREIAAEQSRLAVRVSVRNLPPGFGPVVAQYLVKRTKPG